MSRETGQRQRIPKNVVLVGGLFDMQINAKGTRALDYNKELLIIF
jgi:hypothetical protein